LLPRRPFSPIEIPNNERGILLSFFRVVTRVHCVVAAHVVLIRFCVCRLRDDSHIARAVLSVAFVFITGRRRDDDVQIPPVEEVKETRIHSASLNAKRESKREKKERINVPSVSANRTSKAASFEGERSAFIMVVNCVSKSRRFCEV